MFFNGGFGLALATIIHGIISSSLTPSFYRMTIGALNRFFCHICSQDSCTFSHTFPTVKLLFAFTFAGSKQKVESVSIKNRLFFHTALLQFSYINNYITSFFRVLCCICSFWAQCWKVTIKI